MLHSLSIAADEKIVIGCILFAIQLLIGAIADDNEDKVINRWFFKEENPKAISYQCENKSNVGSTVTFESDCDTVYVSRYKW